MTATVHLATQDGLVSVDPSGATLAHEHAGLEVCSVDTGDGAVFVVITGAGVQRGRAGSWERLGLEDADVWVVAAGEHGIAYAGTEPAALWRVGDGDPVDLAALRDVEDAREWHSPWGPADLCAIVAEGSRLLVGIEVGGVAVSHDGGATWEARNKGLYEDVHHLVAHGSRLVATTGMGLYRSADEGQTWEWESDGIDRGYAMGLARSGSRVLASAASGPPPMWEAGGPEAAIFGAELGDGPLAWTLLFDGFGGAIERQALAAAGDVVVAGTTAGELLVSRDGGRSFVVVRGDLAPVNGVTIENG